MRIAYLINQYPKVSHTFIRREIQALERAGVEITRLSLRGWNEPLVDPEDIVALYIDGPDVNDGSDPACLKLLMTGVALQHVRIVKRCFGRVENPHDGVANGFYFAPGTVMTPVPGKQLGAPREVRATHFSHALVA